MSNEFDYKELFGIYAAEAGSYLPRRKRQDIQMEILSLLEDALEDKSASSGHPVDEEMALEVLKEFGPPINFAGSYRTDNILIGPDIFPLFRPTLTLFAIIYVAQFLVSGIIALTRPNFDILATVDAFFDKGFQLFGILVFAFALIERTTPKGWLRWPFKEMARTWDPKTLIKDNKKALIKPAAYFFEALFMLGFSILFAFFPQWIGFGNNTNGVWNFLPMLSREISPYLPWIAAYFLIRFIFDIIMAQQGHWDNRMRWVDIGTRLIGLGLIAALYVGPAVFGINETYLAMHTYSPDLLAWFRSTLDAWNSGFGVYLFITMLVQIIIIVSRVIRLVLNRKAVVFLTPTKTI